MTSTMTTPAAAPSAGEPPRIAETMYHDLLSPPEITELRERVRSVARTSIAPLAQRISRSDERIDGFPRDAFDALAADGIFRIPSAPTSAAQDSIARPPRPR